MDWIERLNSAIADPENAKYEVRILVVKKES